MTTTPESADPNESTTTSNGAGVLKPGPKREDPECPWKQRNLDTAKEVVRRWVAARNALNTAQAAFKQADAALRYGQAEGLLEERFDVMSEEYDFSDQGVVFTKQTRRSWAMDCYSDELQAAIKAEQEIREPRVSESLRARFVG
jgi:hypothetical protein